MKKSKQGYSSVRVKVYAEKGRVIDRYVRFKNTGCKYFFNAQHLFINLSSKDRSFFDYLCEKMDSKNRVVVDVHFKKEYLLFMDEILGKNCGIKITGIDKTLKKLKLLTFWSKVISIPLSWNLALTLNKFILSDNGISQDQLL